MTVVPYKEEKGSKKEQVARMFDNISGKYDFLNHFLSLGIDRVWRKKAISYLKEKKPSNILDVATGTGDFAIECLRLNPEKITGIDISSGMLRVGKEKIRKRSLEEKIELFQGDSENIPFENNTFDAVTVAYGVRNFENLEKGLAEIYRVLKPNGRLVVLEFSKPSKFPFKQLYHFYFNTILPKIGNSISRDSSAYTYLPESVRTFPDGSAFLDILRSTGYKDVLWESLTFGISSVYLGTK